MDDDDDYDDDDGDDRDADEGKDKKGKQRKGKEEEAPQKRENHHRPSPLPATTTIIVKAPCLLSNAFHK